VDIKDLYPIRINSLTIQNYRGIDRLNIDFPKPISKFDPDVTVIGSLNGVGKSSVLECCSLLALLSRTPEGTYPIFQFMPATGIMIMQDIIIRAGANFTLINGEISSGKENKNIKITISRDNSIQIEGTGILKPLTNNQTLGSFIPKAIPDSGVFPQINQPVIDAYLETILGVADNPLTSEFVLFFHSYRKIQSGNPFLDVLTQNGAWDYYQSRISNFSFSYFKIRILQLLMTRAGLLEGANKEEAEEQLSKLNRLAKEYFKGEINQLKASVNNTMELRVKLLDESGTFSFDSLSSGQKEIIQMLFLIWQETENLSRLVLIDEPELHLNVNWHRNFIRMLFELSPQNPYIFATHSEDIMSSVEEDRRIVLSLE